MDRISARPRVRLETDQRPGYRPIGAKAKKKRNSCTDCPVGVSFQTKKDGLPLARKYNKGWLTTGKEILVVIAVYNENCTLIEPLIAWVRVVVCV